MGRKAGEGDLACQITPWTTPRAMEEAIVEHEGRALPPLLLREELAQLGKQPQGLGHPRPMAAGACLDAEDPLHEFTLDVRATCSRREVMAHKLVELLLSQCRVDDPPRETLGLP